MTEPFQIRVFAAADSEAVLALNEANTPEVGPLDQAKLNLLVSEALVFDVVEADGTIEGALVVLGDSGTYASPNYKWFSERNPTFAYVDRIMLSPVARGNGLGVRLYERAVDAARTANKPVLCCEVNTIPPNPRSLRFHQTFGFTEVARTRPYGKDEEVAMLERDIC